MTDPKNKLTEAAVLDDSALENAVGGVIASVDNSPKLSIPNTTPADTEEENALFV